MNDKFDGEENSDSDNVENRPNDIDHHQLTTTELSWWAEFCCWTVVLLSLPLYWFNGPAVSTDQVVVRCSLVALAITGGIVLRFVNRTRC